MSDTMKEYIAEAEKDLLHTYNRYQIVLDKGEGVHLYDTDGKKYLDHFHLKITIPTIATAMPMAFRHSQGCFSTPNHPNSSIIYATAS